MIIIINGPSGSGKTTLGDYFGSLGLKEIVSTTTRSPREGEIDGVSYYFVTEDEFFARERVEESYYSGNYYGVTKKEVESKIGRGESAYVSLDFKGALRFKELYPDDTILIYLKVSRTLIRRRMFQRGESIKTIRQRLMHHRTTREDLNGQFADYIIYNHKSLNDLKKQGLKILKAEGIIEQNKVETIS